MSTINITNVTTNQTKNIHPIGGQKMSIENFDNYATAWDTPMRIKRAKKVAEEIKKQVTVSPKTSAMEFGCGTGLVSFNLYKDLESVTLVDTSAGMIDILNEKIKGYGATNMNSLQADIMSESQVTQQFDLIYHSMVLHHVKDTLGVLKRFHDCLEKEGQLCIVDLDEEDGSFHYKYPEFDGHNGFNQEDLQNKLKEAGFTNIQSHSFYFDKKEMKGEEKPYSLFIMTATK